MQMPMYGSPIGYNQPYGGWQAPQQLYQPQTNSFMPKAQNAAESLYMELENFDYDMVYIAEIQPDYSKKFKK